MDLTWFVSRHMLTLSSVFWGGGHVFGLPEKQPCVWPCEPLVEPWLGGKMCMAEATMHALCIALAMV